MAAVAVLSQLFMLWMLVDAAQRRMGTIWYLIILMPFGEWVYFFSVKVNDYDLGGIRRLLGLDRPPAVGDLRHLVSETPSVENQLKLAEALRATGEHEEAAGLYRQVLARDANDTDALYGMAVCHMGRDDAGGAIDALSRLIDVDPSYRDWGAWQPLAFAYGCADRPAESRAVLEKLVERAPRIRHKVLLGKQLARGGETDRARRVLREAITDYKHSQGFVKRTNGRWVRDARAVLRKLPA